jgi:hypothetical protein
VCPTGCADLHWDANNCGTCGHTCPGPNAYCSYGSCATLTELVPNTRTWGDQVGHTRSIAVDSNNVYWNDGSNINQVPIGGGSVLVLAPSGGGEIAVDATFVYYMTSGGGGIFKVPIGGGTPTSIDPGDNCTSSLAVDSTYVYFLCYGLFRVSKSGGPVTTLSTNDGFSMSLGNGNAYWAYPSSNQSIFGIPVTGGTATALAQGVNTPMATAADSSNVYWTEGTNPGNVVQLSLSGGLPQTLASNQVIPTWMLVDATHVYWSGSDLLIQKVPIGGGTITPVAQNSYGPMAIDSTSLYFSGTPLGGNIINLYKLTPK